MSESFRCLGTGCRVSESSLNKVYLPQHVMLLSQVPQGCVHNLSQEQLHAHKDSGTASPSHIFQFLEEGYLELSNRVGSPSCVTGEKLGWG